MTSYFELQDLKDDNMKRKAIKRRFFLFNKAKAECYNTHEAVNFIEYAEFLYHREYKNDYSNENLGLVPNTQDIPPYSKQKKTG